MYDNGGMLQETVDEIAARLGAAATLEDRSLKLLAYAAQSGDIDTVRQESILRRRASDEVRAYFEGYGIATAPGRVRIPADAELGVLARVCVPLRHDGVTYGYLWLLDDGTLTDERLASVAGLVGRAAAALAQEARRRRDLGAHLRELFSADAGERARALPLPDALDLRGPVAAIAVHGPADRVAALWTLPRDVLAEPGLPAADGPLVGLLAPAAHAREVAGRVQAMYGTAAGIGGARDEPGEAWLSWREAVGALRAAVRVPGLAPVADWSGLGVYRALLRLAPADLRELAGETAALAADPELARTVEGYLDRAGHVQETAAALGVHRQTLYYRLGKAERLTGRDLGDGEARLLVHLSLKAARLL
ncbi:helix-turn-helix domain-containing protein [Planomonospora sp. ID91781]|uniref:CdaR family transcriptional regulator n=1 Tax=Planomonospora sphaerica TaxID=161355 RepID=A0A171B4S6_9ACTN|nr:MULTISPECIES: helix-turn-helix domain-containing protein [Planomonospora]MBG0822216.1 helix-turn-helix domain-containing protein [Planomonospora sp. ID91781]GAT64658.1 cdaR family transcriptional regulator [Planomonospora sphaerica]